MGRKTKNQEKKNQAKYQDYFGNRFDELGTTVRNFHKNNTQAALALGLILGFSVLAGAGYFVFSGGSSSEIEQTFQPQPPVEQEIVRQNELPAQGLNAMAVPAKAEQVQKLITPKKKITKNKKALKAGQSKKVAKIKKAQKQNLICINPAQLKALKKNKVASSKRR